MRTVRRDWMRPLRSAGSVYLIVCVASAAAAVIGVASLFDDEAPVPHAGTSSGASLAWRQAR